MRNEKLVEYIRLSFTQGKPKEEIYKNLLNQGWGVEEIQDAFNQIVTKEEKEDTEKRTLGIILTIGAILVGVGIFFFYCG